MESKHMLVSKQWVNEKYQRGNKNMPLDNANGSTAAQNNGV